MCSGVDVRGRKGREGVVDVMASRSGLEDMRHSTHVTLPTSSVEARRVAVTHSIARYE